LPKSRGNFKPEILARCPQPAPGVTASPCPPRAVAIVGRISPLNSFSRALDAETTIEAHPATTPIARSEFLIPRISRTDFLAGRRNALSHRAIPPPDPHAPNHLLPLRCQPRSSGHFRAKRYRTINPKRRTAAQSRHIPTVVRIPYRCCRTPGRRGQKRHDGEDHTSIVQPKQRQLANDLVIPLLCHQRDPAPRHCRGRCVIPRKNTAMPSCAGAPPRRPRTRNRTRVRDRVSRALIRSPSSLAPTIETASLAMVARPGRSGSPTQSVRCRRPKSIWT